MDFLSTRAEHLAAHIRQGILQQQWREPFPSTRDWARKLGVARNTLGAALALLEQEGTLRIEHRQGIRLGQAKQQSNQPRRTRLLRILYYGVDFDAVTSDVLWWAGLLSETLGEREIYLRIEKCSDKRLRQICSARGRREDVDELLLLLSLPSRYQQLVAASKRPAIHIGVVSKGVDLPFVSSDFTGAMSHAAHRLLRHGFMKLTLIQTQRHNPGVESRREAFLAACHQWPHQPIQGDMLRLPPSASEQRLRLNRFVNGIKARQGIVTDSSQYVALLMTMLLSRGIAVPSQVELIAVDCIPEMVCVHPPIAQYPHPVEMLAKVITKAAVHFFETGFPPALRQVLPVNLVTAPE